MAIISATRWLAGAGLFGAAALLSGCAVYGAPGDYGYGVPAYYAPGPAVIGVPYVDIDVYDGPRYWRGRRPSPYPGAPGWRPPAAGRPEGGPRGAPH
ncbi:MAG: hypothetical protein QM586_07600, partial [Xenophilus sp.]